VQPLCHAEALGILPGDLQGAVRTINCPHVRLRQRMRQADRQVSTARPHIQDSQTSLWIRCTPLLHETCAMFNQHFAFRAWDEHLWTNDEFQRPEFLLSRDVLHWFATPPALQA
jgi:hypothetical protein